jgi:hypothetical protein
MQKNPEMCIDEILLLFKNLSKVKKTNKFFTAYTELYPFLLKGEFQFFNGQLNAFNRYIDEKLYNDIKTYYPEISEEKFNLLLDCVLGDKIFLHLMINGSVKKSRNF